MILTRAGKAVLLFLGISSVSVAICGISLIGWNILNHLVANRPGKAILADFIPIGYALFVFTFICGSGIAYKRYWWAPATMVWGIVTISASSLRVNPTRSPVWWWDHGTGWSTLAAGVVAIILVA